MTYYLQNEVIQLQILQESYLHAEIRLVEATSEVDGLKDDNREIIEAIEQQEQNLARLKAEFDVITKEARAMNMKELISRASDEVKELFSRFKDAPMEDLDHEIAEVKSRLDLMADGNPQAIRAYEDREREIGKVQQSLAGTADKLEYTRTRITEIREQWEPELDRIVSAISDGFAHNFNRIGCAGQVSVKKDEDFDKWAIQIEVSFRWVDYIVKSGFH